MAITAAQTKFHEIPEETLKGTTIIGPFSDVSLSEVSRKMEKHSIFAFGEECIVEEDLRENGETWLKVTSDQATGYLLGLDGAEASTTDAHEFILDILSHGETLTVEGHYPDGIGGVVVSHARYANVGGEVLKNMERKRQNAEGEVANIHFIDELEVHENTQRWPDAENVVCLASFRKKREM
jgi:hypothetical protein